MRNSGTTSSSLESLKVMSIDRKLIGLNFDNARANAVGFGMLATNSQIEPKDIFCHCLLVTEALENII